MTSEFTKLSDEFETRLCRMVEVGEAIESYSPYSVKPYEGNIGTALVSEYLLSEFEQVLASSPTGCVLLLGSSYGGTYYFRTKELWRRWHDVTSTTKTADYPGAFARSGAVVAA